MEEHLVPIIPGKIFFMNTRCFENKTYKNCLSLKHYNFDVWTEIMSTVLTSSDNQWHRISPSHMATILMMCNNGVDIQEVVTSCLHSIYVQCINHKKVHQLLEEGGPSVEMATKLKTMHTLYKKSKEKVFFCLSKSDSHVLVH